MKKLFFLLAAALVIQGCYRVEEFDPSEGSNHLVDSTFTNPSFVSGTSNLSYTTSTIKITRTPASSMYLYYTSDYGLYKLYYNSSGNIGSESYVQTGSSLYNIGAEYDSEYDAARLVYVKENGTYDNVTGVNIYNYSGAYNTFNINALSLVTDVNIFKAGNNWIVYMYNSNVFGYKTITYSSSSSASVYPAYSLQSSNLISLSTGTSSFSNVNMVYNTNSSTSLACWRYGYFLKCAPLNSGQGSLYAPITLSGNMQSGNIAASVCPLGNNFLITWVSNVDIADQNQGYSNYAGEHIRMAVVNSTGSVNNIEYDNEWVVNDENSIALPVSINSSDVCTSVKSVSDLTNDQAGVSYIKNNKVYFFKAKLAGTKLKISPPKYLGSVTSASRITDMKCYNGIYYIVILNNDQVAVISSM